MNGRAWTRKELRRLRQMRSQGCLGREIAEALGRSLHAVNTKIYVLGLGKGAQNRHQRWTQAQTETMRRMFAEGCTEKEVAEALGRTPAAVCTARKRNGWVKYRREKEWSVEEMRRLRQIRAQGISYRTAALVLGRTHKATAKKSREIKNRYL